MTESFSIVPGHVRVLWLAIPVLLGLSAIGTLLYSMTGAWSARFEVSSQGLRLRGDFFGRLIPLTELRLDEARAINLGAEPTLAPVVRTLGTAIGGYRAGWFRLRDGEKALLYVTDPTRVAYVPTTAGYAVLLSVADPPAFLASLRTAAGKAGGASGA